MRILVNCTGFIGDHLFASSLAKKLKEKYEGCHVAYRILLRQPELLLKQNPYIDEVYLGHTDGQDWDLRINVPVIDPAYPATIQIQAAAGIEDQSLEFDVWTVPEYDDEAEADLMARSIFSDDSNPFVAIQNDWSWKAYACTPETLAKGIGAPHRDTNKIARVLRDEFELVAVGFNREIAQTDPIAANEHFYAYTASLIKHCDWFIGSEGGLSNLAAAVGTKCIITTDYIWQNYGPNGRVRKCDPPMMGPATYYPDAGHVHLDPCLTDDEIIEEIKKVINGNN